MSGNRAEQQTFQTLNVDRQADVVTVTLNRPQARNAMSLQMCRDVIDAFQSFRFDSGVRLILIRGAGPVFCAGIDLKETKGKPRDWVLERRNLGLDAFMAIENSPAPVVAAVHGAVIGAGCEIMAAADFAVAAEDTKFQWPEVIWGAVGATQRLARLVGLPTAKDLLFTGRVIVAPEALRLRIVSRVVEPAKFESAVATVTEEMLRAFPLAARLVKKSMALGRDLPIHVGVEFERQLIERSLVEGEWAAGTDAFEEHLRKRSTEKRQ